jgi:hypothetical protein
MRNCLLAILLLTPVLAWGKSKPTDYNIAVHVQSSQLATVCHDVLGHWYCGIKQHLTVVIDGRKIRS